LALSNIDILILNIDSSLKRVGERGERENGGGKWEKGRSGESEIFYY
jgi:hypothetical protein